MQFRCLLKTAFSYVIWSFFSRIESFFTLHTHFTIHTVFTLFTLSILFATNISSVYANENFSLSLRADYTVLPQGGTRVEQHFTLTNKTPTLFVNKYAVEFGSTQLQNVRVFDQKGDLPANIVTTNNKTSIGISFNDPVVGEGKGRTFTISFDSSDIALSSGNVVEVYIPKLTNAPDYQDYTVKLKVPTQLGQPARIAPSTFTNTQENEFNVFTFEQNNGQGITAIFGQRQIFDYQLRYSLTNQTGTTGIAQIALPPDTNRQKVQYTSLNPQPEKVALDADGNWIATYQLSAQKELEVLLTGKVAVFLENQPHIFPTAALAEHINEQKYWETSNTQIRQLAEQYKTPKEIYDYVVTQLNYNYEKINSDAPRLGAVAALSDPNNAVCQEFTDAFIAIARAAGIPARRATGYAYAENSKLRPVNTNEEVLHTWPEYFDTATNTWVPVDPTWTDTTGGVNYFDQFDFNHVVFAYNGVSSTLPHPAGSYSSDSDRTSVTRDSSKPKDVVIEFGKDFPAAIPTFSTEVKRTSFLIAPFRNDFTLVIKNNTGAAWYKLPVNVKLHSASDPTTAVSQTISAPLNEIDYILPYQTREFHITVDGSSLILPQTLGLTVSGDGLSSSHELKTGLNIKEIFLDPTVAPITLGGSLVIFTILAGGLLVLRRVRQRALRGQSKKPQK